VVTVYTLVAIGLNFSIFRASPAAAKAPIKMEERKEKKNQE
jgi:hypothetical protein